MAETTLVQMRLRPDTVREVGELQHLLGAESRVGAIKLAIATALLVVRALVAGKVVSIENDAGNLERILIPGVGGTPAQAPDRTSQRNSHTPLTPETATS